MDRFTSKKRQASIQIMDAGLSSCGAINKLIFQWSPHKPEGIQLVKFANKSVQILCPECCRRGTRRIQHNVRSLHQNASHRRFSSDQ